MYEVILQVPYTRINQRANLAISSLMRLSYPCRAAKSRRNWHAHTHICYVESRSFAHQK